jgi:hypothetical protein
MRRVFLLFIGTMVYMKESTGKCIEVVLKIIRDTFPIEKTGKGKGNKNLKPLY